MQLPHKAKHSSQNASLRNSCLITQHHHVYEKYLFLLPFFIPNILGYCIHDPLFVYTPKQCHHSDEYSNENIDKCKRLDSKYAVESGKEIPSDGHIPYEKLHCIDARRMESSDSDFGENYGLFISRKIAAIKTET